jgi:transcriptional regulator with XRE-family HTH domain
MTLNERIGFEMRSQRLLKRLTLEEVASRMGIRSKNTVSRMELGITKITVEDLEKYCDAVGCSWIEILRKAEDNAGI